MKSARSEASSSDYESKGTARSVSPSLSLEREGKPDADSHTLPDADGFDEVALNGVNHPHSSQPTTVSNNAVQINADTLPNHATPNPDPNPWTDHDLKHHLEPAPAAGTTGAGPAEEFHSVPSTPSEAGPVVPGEWK